MLKTDQNALILDPISEMIGQLNGNDFTPEVLEEGIIIISHFSADYYLQDYKKWIGNNLSINEYGVCDHYTQILKQCPELKDPERVFLITLTPIKRKNQPSSGGWRWHKWGPYIGTKTPKHEYLYDEDGIDEVFVYNIYEKDL